MFSTWILAFLSLYNKAAAPIQSLFDVFLDSRHILLYFIVLTLICTRIFDFKLRYPRLNVPPAFFALFFKAIRLHPFFKQIGILIVLAAILLA